MVSRKSFYIHWSVGRSPRVHEVNPGRDPSPYPIDECDMDNFIKHDVKPVKNLNLNFFKKKGKKVIFLNSPGGKAGIFLDLG